MTKELLCIAAFGVIPLSVQAQSIPSRIPPKAAAVASPKPDTSMRASELIDAAANLIGPKFDEAFKKQFFSEEGLRKISNDPEKWEKQDSTGLVRFVQMFDKFWMCVYFPEHAAPLPDPLIEALVKSAKNTVIVEDGLVELTLPNHANVMTRTDVKTSWTVTFRGAAITARKVIIEW